MGYDEGISFWLYKYFQGWFTASCITVMFILYILLCRKKSARFLYVGGISFCTELFYSVSEA